MFLQNENQQLVCKTVPGVIAGVLHLNRLRWFLCEGMIPRAHDR
jgi:hypothetical protein